MGHPFGDLFVDRVFRPVRMQGLDRMIDLILGIAPHAEGLLEPFGRGHCAVNLDLFFIQPFHPNDLFIHRLHYTEILWDNQ